MSDAIINTNNNNPNLDSVNPNDMVEIGQVSDSVVEQQQPKPPQQQQQNMVQIPESEYRKYLESGGTILMNRVKTDNELDKHLQTKIDNAVNMLQEIGELVRIKISLKQNALLPNENTA